MHNPSDVIIGGMIGTVCGSVPFLVSRFFSPVYFQETNPQYTRGDVDDRLLFADNSKVEELDALMGGYAHPADGSEAISRSAGIRAREQAAGAAAGAAA